MGGVPAAPRESSALRNTLISPRSTAAALLLTCIYSSVYLYRTTVLYYCSCLLLQRIYPRSNTPQRCQPGPPVFTAVFLLLQLATPPRTNSLTPKRKARGGGGGQHSTSPRARGGGGGNGAANHTRNATPRLAD